MLSIEDNEMISNTNRGTPMGEVFRRFWLPVALAEELPGPDSVPVRVKVMGEDLIAFRNTDGEVGLVDAYCPHRGAPMFFGRNEENGLRCIYHGIKFDLNGNCLDIPIAPEGPSFMHKLKIRAYPIVEAGDLIWAYMGPLEKKPPFPEFEWSNLPKTHRFISKFRLECNYLQAMEGDSDQNHSYFLHSSLDRADPASWASPFTPRFQQKTETSRDNVRDHTQMSSQKFNPREQAGDDQPVYDSMGGRRITEPNYSQLEVNDSGCWKVSVNTLADGRKSVSLGWWKMPVFTSQQNIRVPIDNLSMYFYRLRWSYEPLPDTVLQEYKTGGYLFPELTPGTYQTKANVHNDYEVDRVAQRFYSFSGIKSFPLQDIAMMENQWGPLADRTQEHLLSSDQAIIFIRRRLLKVAKDLQIGIEPSEPWHPEAYAYRTASVTVDAPLSDERLNEIIEELKVKAKTRRVAPTAPKIEA